MRPPPLRSASGPRAHRRLPADHRPASASGRGRTRNPGAGTRCQPERCEQGQRRRRRRNGREGRGPLPGDAPFRPRSPPGARRPAATRRCAVWSRAFRSQARALGAPWCPGPWGPVPSARGRREPGGQRDSPGSRVRGTPAPEAPPRGCFPSSGVYPRRAVREGPEAKGAGRAARGGSRAEERGQRRAPAKPAAGAGGARRDA